MVDGVEKARPRFPDRPPIRLDDAGLRMLQGLPDAYLVEHEGMIVFANAAAAERLGVAGPSELLGRPALDLPLDLTRTEIAASFGESEAVLVSLTATGAGDPTARQLRRSEERYRAVVELCPDAIWVNIGGHIAFINSAGVRLLGAGGADDIVGRSIFEIFHPDSHPGVRARVRRILEEGARTELRHERVLRLDGRAVDVEITAVRIPVESGDGILVVARDLTARTLAEADSNAWNDRSSALREASHVFLYDWNAAEDRISLIGAADSLFGAPSGGDYPLEAWISKIHPDDQIAYRAGIARLQAGGDALRLEYRVRREDDRWVVVEDRAVPHRRIGGAVERVIGVVTDVTERSRAQAALREAEARARTILDSAHEGIVTIDEVGVIESFNRGAERLFGWSSAEIVGRPIERLIPGEGWNAREPLRDLSRDSAGGLPAGRGRAVTGLRRDGTSFPLYLSVSEVPLGHRRTSLCLLHDLSEQHELEAQLRQAQKMEAVGLLAGGVAHDFNNLLLTILGRTEMMLAAGGPGDALRPQLDQIRKAAERGAQLTRQLLAFSRRQVMRPRVLDLNTLILDLVEMLRHLIGEDIELALELDPGLGHLRADPGMIEQVVMNLVVNARDAMPDGGRIRIATHNVDRSDGARLALSIEDTGSGMDAATVARIFEPFFSTKPAGRGSGLGLSTVDGIVKQSGGEIQVRSRPGEGSEFRIVLPRVDDALESEPERAGASGASGGNETILLVEDDDAARELLPEYLESRGYRVLAAATAKEALNLVEQERAPIDLLLTDLGLPDMRGTALADEIRRRRPALRVIFVSGYTEEAVGTPAQPAGSSEFLHKPFALREVAERIRHLLDLPR